MAPGSGDAPLSPHPSELLPIVERAWHLTVLRVGLGTLTLISCAVAPIATVPISWIAAATGAYVGGSAAVLAVGRRGRRLALPVLHGGLLIDGIYLAAVVAFTGAAGSELRILPMIHVVAVTLLVSYRTGLKLALWHTLLFLWVVQALDAGLFPGLAAGPAVGAPVGAMGLTISGIWLLTLGAGAYSAASERALRRQKAHLARLTEMVVRIDAAGTTGEIPSILLADLESTFDLRRGVVLASPRGKLELLASTEPSASTTLAEGPDQVVARAWSRRLPQLVRRLEPNVDPRLASLLPDARNVLVLPISLDGGERLGVVALEHGSAVTGMARWEVDMVAQFVAHAALALHNGWLRDEREAQLERIRGLERRLRRQNAELEVKVAERTEDLRELIGELEDIDRQRRNLLAHVVHVAEDERRRIANDVHDDPVQKLAAAKMRLEMLAAEHPELPDIDAARTVITSAIRGLRRMVFDLSPPILDDEGIGAALRYFLEHSAVDFEWTVYDELPAEPSTQTRMILYRIGQEALINTRKHAGAGRVTVRLAERDGGVWMEVEDDGVGFQPQEAAVAAPGHLGIAAMRERAEMAGGRCALRSLPGAGTNLQVWLPADVARAGAGVQHPPRELAAVIPLQDRIA